MIGRRKFPERKVSIISFLGINCYTSTGLLVRVEDRNQSDALTSAIEYDDYREVDGIKVPFALHYIEDAHFIIKLAEVKQNVAIEDAVFVKPKK